MHCLEGEWDHDVGQQKRTISCCWVGKEGGRLWGGGLGRAQRAYLLLTERRSAGPSTFASVFCAPSSSYLSSQSSTQLDSFCGGHLLFVYASSTGVFGAVHRCFKHHCMHM